MEPNAVPGTVDPPAVEAPSNPPIEFPPDVPFPKKLTAVAPEEREEWERY